MKLLDALVLCCIKWIQNEYCILINEFKKCLIDIHRFLINKILPHISRKSKLGLKRRLKYTEILSAFLLRLGELNKDVDKEMECLSEKKLSIHEEVYDICGDFYEHLSLCTEEERFLTFVFVCMWFCLSVVIMINCYFFLTVVWFSLGPLKVILVDFMVNYILLMILRYIYGIDLKSWLLLFNYIMICYFGLSYWFLVLNFIVYVLLKLNEKYFKK